MAKKLDIVALLAWIVGILVSLAVGFGMVSKTLIIPKIPEVITTTAGWVVVVVTIVGIILAIVKKI